MIKLHELTYKNLQSVGNHPIKIQVDRSPTTVIGGQNGAGKSTMLMALAYNWFGKFISGVKQAEAINTVNKKQLYTTSVFTVNGDKFEVIRGEKPKKFEIIKNGTPYNQEANARDQQKILEVILGMDYKVFTQIVLLNKERYTPFMDMGAAERRKVVEEVLGITIISEMNEVCKARITEAKREITNIERDRSNKQTEIQGQQRLVEQIQRQLQQASEDLNTQKEEKQNEHDSLAKQVVDIETKMEALDYSELPDLEKQLDEYNKLGVQFEAQVNSNKKHAEFFVNNSECPTCGQEIDSELQSTKKHDCEVEINEINAVISEMMTEVQGVSERLKELKQRQKQYTELFNERSVLWHQMSILEKDIKGILKRSEESCKDEELNEAIALYERMDQELKELTTSLRTKTEQLANLERVRESLKDDGIKANIVNEYIPLINKKVNEFLQAMNFFINIRLDDNFKESFHAINKENFSINNLSTGQKARVNLSIWMALLEVASVKNSVVTNALFLDEILENFDDVGVKDFINLCNEKLSDKHLFVITQRFNEFEDLFRSSIQFKLNNGFTEMVR